MIHEINWKFISSMGFTNQHLMVCIDDEHKLKRETVTPRKWNGEFGKPNHSYFMQNDEREFLSEEDLIEAFNEKYKFDEDNPEHEVVYIKVIKNRKTGKAIKEEIGSPENDNPNDYTPLKAS